MLPLAFGVSASIISFHTAADPKNTHSTAPSRDLSQIYRIATECDKNGEVLYTFVLTKKTEDTKELASGDQAQIQMIESDRDALKSRIRMIREADAERFLPSDTRIDESWKKADKYALKPCP